MLGIVIGFGTVAVILFIVAFGVLYPRLLKKIDQWYKEGYR
jgi:hypothetical protein